MRTPRDLAQRAVPLAAVLFVAACGQRSEAPPAATKTVAASPAPSGHAAPADAPGIAWRHAASDADVDAAFALAKQDGKPVFLYWGAAWCPPCNQVKATLFNRQDFIERSRAFVPVYVDGDSPGAQKLGSRFKVSGYPTMLLFNPAGAEITRLPGEVDPSRYGAVLDLGMNATRPVKTLVADALAEGPSRQALTGNDWRLLAYYSWDTDQEQVIGKDAVARTLGRLAAACPPEQAETALRLRLKALAMADAKPVAPVDDATRRQVVAVLADPAKTREQADIVVNSAGDIAKALAPDPGPARAEVAAAFDGALRRLQADASLSRADRMQALISRVDLARLDELEVPKGKPAPEPTLPAALVADVRAESARADREITDGYERQAVVTSAAYLLERAGLPGESDALLESNLPKSHSPYYLMSELASNARKRGDNPRAVAWYAKAWQTSEGPATRLQWGASYLGALVDLAPADEAAIETAAASIWKEAMAQPDAFQQRSGRSLQRVGQKIAAWNQGGAHAAAASRLRGTLDGLCATRDAADRAECGRLLDARPAARKA